MTLEGSSSKEYLKQLLAWIWEAGIILDFEDVCTRIEEIFEKVDYLKLYFNEERRATLLLFAVRKLQKVVKELNVKNYREPIGNLLKTIIDLLKNKESFVDEKSKAEENYIRQLFSLYQNAILFEHTLEKTYGVDENIDKRRNLFSLDLPFDSEKWNRVKNILNFKDDTYKDEVTIVAELALGYTSHLSKKKPDIDSNCNLCLSLKSKIKIFYKEMVKNVPSALQNICCKKNTDEWKRLNYFGHSIIYEKFHNNNFSSKSLQKIVSELIAISQKQSLSSSSTSGETLPSPKANGDYFPKTDEINASHTMPLNDYKYRIEQYHGTIDQVTDGYLSCAELNRYGSVVMNGTLWEIDYKDNDRRNDIESNKKSGIDLSRKTSIEMTNVKTGKISNKGNNRSPKNINEVSTDSDNAKYNRLSQDIENLEKLIAKVKNIIIEVDKKKQLLINKRDMLYGNTRFKRNSDIDYKDSNNDHDISYEHNNPSNDNFNTSMKKDILDLDEPLSPVFKSSKFGFLTPLKGQSSTSSTCIMLSENNATDYTNNNIVSEDITKNILSKRLENAANSTKILMHRSPNIINSEVTDVITQNCEGELYTNSSNIDVGKAQSECVTDTTTSSINDSVENIIKSLRSINNIDSIINSNPTRNRSKLHSSSDTDTTSNSSILLPNLTLQVDPENRNSKILNDAMSIDSDADIDCDSDLSIPNLTNYGNIDNEKPSIYPKSNDCDFVLSSTPKRDTMFRALDKGIPAVRIAHLSSSFIEKMTSINSSRKSVWGDESSLSTIKLVVTDDHSSLENDVVILETDRKSNSMKRKLEEEDNHSVLSSKILKSASKFSNAPLTNELQVDNSKELLERILNSSPNYPNSELQNLSKIQSDLCIPSTESEDQDSVLKKRKSLHENSESNFENFLKHFTLQQSKSKIENEKSPKIKNGNMISSTEIGKSISRTKTGNKISSTETENSISKIKTGNMCSTETEKSISRTINKISSKETEKSEFKIKTKNMMSSTEPEMSTISRIKKGSKISSMETENSMFRIEARNSVSNIETGNQVSRIKQRNSITSMDTGNRVSKIKPTKSVSNAKMENSSSRKCNLLLADPLWKNIISSSDEDDDKDSDNDSTSEHSSPSFNGELLIRKNRRPVVAASFFKSKDNANDTSSDQESDKTPNNNKRIQEKSLPSDSLISSNRKKQSDNETVFQHFAPQQSKYKVERRKSKSRLKTGKPDSKSDMLKSFLQKEDGDLASQSSTSSDEGDLASQSSTSSDEGVSQRKTRFSAVTISGSGGKNRKSNPRSTLNVIDKKQKNKSVAITEHDVVDLNSDNRTKEKISTSFNNISPKRKNQSDVTSSLRTRIKDLHSSEDDLFLPKKTNSSNIIDSDSDEEDRDAVIVLNTPENDSQDTSGTEFFTPESTKPSIEGSEADVTDVDDDEEVTLLYESERKRATRSTVNNTQSNLCRKCTIKLTFNPEASHHHSVHIYS